MGTGIVFRALCGHGSVLKGSSLMMVPRLLFFVVHRLDARTGEMSPRHRLPGRHEWLAMSFVLASVLLASCSNVKSGGNTTNTIPGETAPQVALAQLHWCGKPVIIFRDEGASPAASAPAAPTTIDTSLTPTVTATARVNTVTDWSQVEPKLGFTIYLPQTLPQNSCLVSASGTLHDPIFGGSFTIGYLLADHSSISLAEAPLRSQSHQFQCTPSSSGSPKAGTPALTLQVCSGVQDGTSIVFSAHGSTNYLQQFFQGLQPHINWVPDS